MKKIFLPLLAGLFFIPTFTIASTITFSEIMYDAEGSDEGYEWVEIKNNSTGPEDLTGYKFCEGTDSVVCHSIPTDDNLSFTIEAGALAIITDDRDKFNSRHSFSGLVLDSTGFSLLNSAGETLELKAEDGSILDSLTYNPESGGKDGDTLSVFNNVWKNGESTPGAENIYKDSDSGGDGGGTDGTNSDNSVDEEEDEDNTHHSYVEVTDVLAGKKKLKAEIDETDMVVTGAEVQISGRAYGLTGVEIKNVEFIWSLGDGTRDRGQIIQHEYYFPGEYLVSLIVKSGGFASPKTLQKITVIDPPIEISGVDYGQNFIEIKNNSDQRLNLQGWMLMLDGEKFAFPDNTYILENGTIKFLAKNIPFRLDIGDRVFLLYPNGKKFQEWGYQPTGQTTQDSTEDPGPKEVDLHVKITPVGVTKQFLNIPGSSNIKEEEPEVMPENKSGYGQAAMILPLKEEENSFVQDNLVEILFIGFLFLVIVSFFFLRSRSKKPAVSEAEQYKILEKD